MVQTEEEVLQCNVTIQIRATEQFFAVVSLIMLFKIILTSESVSQILKCDHSNEVSEHYHAPVVLFIMFIMIYDITRKYTTRKILKNRTASVTVFHHLSDTIGNTWPEYILPSQENALGFALVA